ncbi:uncharacterized protein F4817DRAFT_312263 [Daldinia loculata]|uniref:uncharacterized protein n=1 Tax=Daldinia loculata TaxID=103429 RepID=UPI0020C1C851|nr:uncharacterized protein F4817DRAFT_312263 [Daldinia loculata]KAI1650909.1 hypothetical protein F4817DRAFT_312263 [Daldinia loculata]
MAEHRMDELRNHGRSTSGKPYKSSHPRRLHPRVPQVSSNVYRTLDNDAGEFSGHDIVPNCWRGSSSNTYASNVQVSDIAGGQLTATSIDFLTRAENGSLTPYPSIDTHAVFSASIPEEGDADAVAHKTTLDLCPLGGSSHHHSSPGVPFLYPTSNTSATTSISDVWRGSYQTDPYLTSAYMDSNSISSNADPYSQSKPQTGNPALDRYGATVTYSPPALDIADNHGDTTWTDSVSSQSQGPYTHYEKTQPESNDSGDPPSARRWSTENNQGSIVWDSASQATQEDDATRQYEDGTGFEDNEIQGNVIRGYMNGEGPWAYGYNMSSG